MKPVPEYHQLSETVFVWHAYNPEVRADCSSTAVRTAEGFVLIDPIRLEEQALERLVGTDKVAAILLTSGNHERAAAYEKRRLDVPVYAAPDSGLTADQPLTDGTTVLGGIAIRALPGGGPGEVAGLFGSTLLLGDAIVHLDRLEILPDKYCTDPALLRRSLQALADWDFDTVCFAHGLPLRGEKARPAILELFTSDPA